MSLTKEQYFKLMSVITGRRNEAITLNNQRQEEVSEQLPAVRIYNEQISDILSKEIEAKIKRDKAGSEQLKAQRHELQAKRVQALVEAGYPADYLELKFFCSRCKDTGYVDNEKCNCLKKLESELLNQDAGLPLLLARENFGTFDMEVFDDEDYIPELLPYRSITQYEYMLNDIMPKIRNYMDSFEDAELSHNILMMGPPGTGKTFLCNCIARALIDRQHSVVYERAGDMFGAMNAEYFAREKNEDMTARIERIESCELLILDDLGTEFMTEFTRSRLFSLITNRLQRGLSTIISTNLSLNQLSSIYGERLVSRFMGVFMLLPFYGRDLRPAAR